MCLEFDCSTFNGRDIKDSIKLLSDYRTAAVFGEDVEEIKTKLEEDGQNVLRFMASNGLVANPKNCPSVHKCQAQGRSNLNHY